MNILLMLCIIMQQIFRDLLLTYSCYCGKISWKYVFYDYFPTVRWVLCSAWFYSWTCKMEKKRRDQRSCGSKVLRFFLKFLLYIHFLWFCMDWASKVYLYCGCLFTELSETVWVVSPSNLVGSYWYLTTRCKQLVNPFQSNFSATRTLPSSYLFWAGKRLGDYL
jgi:hypothetical protein